MCTDASDDFDKKNFHNQEFTESYNFQPLPFAQTLQRLESDGAHQHQPTSFGADKQHRRNVQMIGTPQQVRIDTSYHKNNAPPSSSLSSSSTRYNSPTLGGGRQQQKDKWSSGRGWLAGDDKYQQQQRQADSLRYKQLEEQR